MKRQNSSKHRRDLNTGSHWTLCVLLAGLLSLLPVLCEILERNYTNVDPAESWVRRTLLLRADDIAGHAYWQFFSYPFLHVTFQESKDDDTNERVVEGGLNLTLWIGCFLTLLFFSRDLERRWGSASLFVYYLFGGLCAGLAACILAPDAAIGGSAGAALAVVTAAALEFGDRAVGGAFRLRYVAVLWLLAYAVYALSRDFDRTVAFSQYGGAVGGFVLLKAEPMGRRWRLAWIRHRRNLHVSEMLRVRNRVDEILDRIREVGIDGLSGEERGFLRRASRLYRKELAERLDRIHETSEW